jgi:phage terminase large subunit-like protein
MAIDNQKLQELLETMQAAADIRTYRKIDFFRPYPKQKAFFDLGATKRERLLMAGNQQGKTEAGAVETTFHLTGLYPDWWQGRRFDHPVIGWAAGETAEVVRDVQQFKLCGAPGVQDSLGTGYIPRDLFADKPSAGRAVTDGFDTIQVYHHTNGVRDGISTLTFKAYVQGRTKFQGKGIDFGWADEEPNDDVYQEFLTRTVATGGLLFMTFTPLKGRSEVVLRFIDEVSEDRAVTNMVIEDALHISPEERKKIVAGYKPHERAARARGEPLLGSGKIFTVAEETVTEATLVTIPREWAKIWGVDFGIDHPFAAALLAWDRDADVIHVLHTIRMVDGLPINHAAAMRPLGINVPVAWPHDGNNRDKGSGEPLSKLYKKVNLRMLGEHATWEDGGNSTEAGIVEMQEREATGRLKYAAHLSDALEERRFYHRKDGLIVKIKDDILSAIRIGIMMKRFAAVVQLGGHKNKNRGQVIADDVDFDLD